jgi:hypothetical protein
MLKLAAVPMGTEVSAGLTWVSSVCKVMVLSTDREARKTG